MPAKKTTLTDAERRRLLSRVGREIGVSQSSKELDRVFAKVVSKPAPKRKK